MSALSHPEPPPFPEACCCHHHPLTNLSGCACAWLDGSSESWSRDTWRIDRAALLRKQNRREQKHQRLVTDTQLVPILGSQTIRARLSQNPQLHFKTRYLSEKGQGEKHVPELSQQMCHAL